MRKLVFLTVVCIILAGINFCCSLVSTSLIGENEYIGLNIQNYNVMQILICDNGFNPNKKKKC